MNKIRLLRAIALLVSSAISIGFIWSFFYMVKVIFTFFIR